MPGIEATRSFVKLVRSWNAAAGDDSLSKEIVDILRAVRTHLGMDVAFVSEFSQGRRVFRFVDSAPDIHIVSVGASDPLDESYCQRIIDGRLPELITDATVLDAARELPATLELPVGAHLSVPIRLRDGRIYGTFCCFSFLPDHTLNERDLNMMRVFADLTVEKIENAIEKERAISSVQDRINTVLGSDLLTVVYQPIYSLALKKVTGYEALSRFSSEPYRAPDIWFSEALQVGLGCQLESRALALALAGLSELRAGEYLSLNVSPGFILNNDLQDVLDGSPLERIVLEVTEHVSIDDYLGLAERIGPLRRKGMRLAVDDAGAGYASFRHVLSLEPDLIKLDASIIRDIDTDFSRRALAIAFISFAQTTGAEIIAEGVETEAQFTTLQQLGVDRIQGNFIGEPRALKGVPPHASAVAVTQ
ncbi:MAG: EAL domain-containing protein [Thiobacillus sp.]|nr:EAL domain-containing protein [Thiobacillus sp.]